MVRDLFRGYNKLIRPVQNMTEKVNVQFGLAFVQLINVVRTVTVHHRTRLSTVFPGGGAGEGGGRLDNRKGVVTLLRINVSTRVISRYINDIDIFFVLRLV